MADVAKVIGHFQDAIEASGNNNKWRFVRTDIIQEAVELLKEQEPVEPKVINLYPHNVWACGNCGHVAVGSLAYKAKYCPECGRKVQWG